MQARLAAAMSGLLRVGQRVGLALQCLPCTTPQQTQVSDTGACCRGVFGHNMMFGQALLTGGRTVQDMVVGLLCGHLSHQLASGKQPPQLSEAPSSAEVHGSFGMCGRSLMECRFDDIHITANPLFTAGLACHLPIVEPLQCRNTGGGSTTALTADAAACAAGKSVCQHGHQLSVL